MSRAMEIITYILTKHVVKDPATLRSIPDLYLQSLTAVIHTLAIVGFDQPCISWYPKVSNQHVNHPTSSALGLYNYEYSAKVQYQQYIHGHLAVGASGYNWYNWWVAGAGFGWGWRSARARIQQDAVECRLLSKIGDACTLPKIEGVQFEHRAKGP
jgi:hypothetical protein